MTSEELHAIVSGPYRMPDGATRRAIWERIPETRPVHCEDPLCPMRLCKWERGFWWVDPDGMLARGTVSVSDRETPVYELPLNAERAIRATIEDWLESVCWRVDTKRQKNGDTVVSAVMDCGAQTRTYTNQRAQKIEALVACAHDVADFLGVTP